MTCINCLERKKNGLIPLTCEYHIDKQFEQLAKENCKR